MAVCSVNFVGESIRKDVPLEVIVPGGAGPFAVLYVLHGLSHDCTWMRRCGIERHLGSLPLILVMPEGQRSFYVNDPRPGGLAFEDHVVKDVVGFVDRTFPTIRDRRARGLAGMSMGGYGSMMLALRHPDVFSLVAAQSSAIFFAHDLECSAPTGVQQYASVLPAGEYDCFELARRYAAAGGAKLAIRMECGLSDSLLPANRQFHTHLQDLGVEHEYHESPGQHNSEYWMAHTREILQFAAERLSQ